MSQTVTPYLLYEDAGAASEFLCRAFNFREIRREAGSDGGTHLEFETPLGGVVFAGQPGPGYANPRTAGRTSLTYVLVADVDAHYEQARTAGAEVFEEPADQEYGHRRYSCHDPQGHEWSFASELG
jgi:PhnB protein